MSKNFLKDKNSFFLLLFLLIFCFLLFVLISGTVFAFRGGSPAYFLKQTEQIDSFTHSEETIFNEIGILRVFTSDTPPVLIILEPKFLYKNNDTPLQEELMKKKENIKNTFITWFSSKTVEEIKNTREDQIKKEILFQLNSFLVLGKLKQLYFEEYQIFDR